MRLYLAVAVGSMLGGSARWGVSTGMLALFGPGFAWGTLLVNGLGSLVIGFYAAMTGPDGRLLHSPALRHGVMTGICGGFTTFSVFSLETLELAGAGRADLAGLNIGLSIVIWLLAVWAGWAWAQRLNRPKAR